MTDTLRAGVVGLKRGYVYARLFQAMPGIELVAVADLDDTLVEAVSTELHLQRGCTSLSELLQSDIDVVAIATPIAQHTPQSIDALESGVHVLCEVPAVSSLEECDALIAAVEQSGKYYMMAENACYFALVDAVKQSYDRGDFGKIFYAEAEFIHNSPSAMRDAQGRPSLLAKLDPILYLTHSLGPIMWVTGQFPVETSCYGSGNNFEPDHTDVQVAIFRMTDGGVVRITCSFRNAHWGFHRLAFFGTRASLDSGWLGIDEPKFWSPSLPNLTRPVTLPLGITLAGVPERGALSREMRLDFDAGALLDASVGGYGGEWHTIQTFVRAIRDGKRAPIDVYDAVMYSIAGICARDAALDGNPVGIPQYQHQRP
jgi:predicted dehydrogenase